MNVINVVHFADKLPQCWLLKDSFTHNSATLWKLWTTHRDQAYETCVQFRKCREEGNVEAQINCKAALNSDECQGNDKCVDALEDCTTPCLVCYWVARKWPKFNGICKPSDPSVQPKVTQEEAPNSQKTALLQLNRVAAGGGFRGRRRLSPAASDHLALLQSEEREGGEGGSAESATTAPELTGGPNVAAEKPNFRPDKNNNWDKVDMFGIEKWTCLKSTTAHRAHRAH